MICFAAHPDDETIGAGGQLRYLQDIWVVHATDGAPVNMMDAHAHGFATREAYARARRDELKAALSLAGIPAERSVGLEIIDQECARSLPKLVEEIVALLGEIQPRTVLAPPYEGGHPDHDSLAFAVHTACRLLRRGGRTIPRIVEYALYHDQGGQMDIGTFLGFGENHVFTVGLSPEDRVLKRRMLECFVTQRETLVPFQADLERFRIAPAYDFSVPPHSGTLYYERFDWGITGAEWRELAGEAAQALGVVSLDDS